MSTGNSVQDVNNSYPIQLLRTLIAVKRGDFSVRMPADSTGMAGKIADALNDIIEMNERMANEFRRVGIAVGKEGRTNQSASLVNASGSWLTCIDSVNTLITDLLQPLAETTRVIQAVANGDLSQTIPTDIEEKSFKGEFLRTAQSTNSMVERLNSLAFQVTKVTQEVGVQGKLGVQSDVRGMSGVWRDMTDSVNLMSDSLATQLRNVSAVTTAVANGDLSKKITVDAKGQILELKDTINTMVDQLNSFTSEVTRVSRELGTEGKLGVQAEVHGVAGTWKDLTDSVNLMANNLTNQVRNISEVSTAIANGDLSRKITASARGEILELKNTINIMVDQLNSFASEATRVSREVGSEGKLGGQAQVRGVAGVWKDLTDSINFMAGSLTAQVRNIAEVTTAVANGDLSKKITVDVKGEILELKNTINIMVDQLNSFASEVTRVAREVGTEGKLGVQAYVRGVAGIWKDLTDNVNSMAGNLTAQVRNIAEVTTAVANGDLSKKITVDVKGEILELKSTINIMVDQLNTFASEVSRVASEVGSEGKLGGQANVMGVAGVWKDLTDNVNLMAGNLTAQVRGIAKIVTAVANGDLKRKLMLEARGEIRSLADTINEMIDTLAIFADQVTTVARDVGVAGKLGGQAEVPGATGTWRYLTDSVNELAATLTTQLRALAEVAIAVTKGDLTQFITVEAQGEVAILKDNINQMVVNLRETTQKNTEQDWLKTNITKFTRMLQGQRDIETVSSLVLSELAPLVFAQHGTFYLMDASETPSPYLKLLSTYAYNKRKHLANRFEVGEGLVGQCALEKQRILITDVPESYIKISSSLGEEKPFNIVVVPILFEGKVTAVIELASFRLFSDVHLTFFDQLTESIAVVLNTIAASMRTEELLKQSQSLAEELKSQQKELTGTNSRLEQQAQSLRASEELLKAQQEQLKKTNEELEEKAELLVLQNREVERKNREIEQARQSLEEKAEQLALTSKYKSEFLANMSHELRTPLNSLLILARLLTDNTEDNLTTKQTEYARTIYSAGNDLLGLINDILDLAKIESGSMAVEPEQVLLTDVRNQMERVFRQVAQDKELNFAINLSSELPRTIYTDPKRLQQILKNLLANAFKFTEQGEVNLKIRIANSGWGVDCETLNRADAVIAFDVNDTGIGIAHEKQRIIFEAFQQADGTTSRKYGGTGLGLSISRDLAQLLGGEIVLVSSLGEGSTFTLYLPQSYQQPIVTSSSRSSSVATLPSADRTKNLTVITPTPLTTNSRNVHAASLGVLHNTPEIKDDRDNVHSDDKTLLIIEDDLNFAHILLEVAREQGFKGLIASNGDAGLSIVQGQKLSAILLDINLPSINGWTVLERLKHDLVTRHIPVCIISVEEGWHRGRQLGAAFYLQKPVSADALTEAILEIKNFVERNIKSLLVVDSDETQCSEIIDFLNSDNVHSTVTNTGAGALQALRGEGFDCIVINPKLPDMNGFTMIEQVRQEINLKHSSIIFYTKDKDLAEGEESELKRLAKELLLKEARSLPYLISKATLSLHQPYMSLPEATRKMLEQSQRVDPILIGKKVLIVDDDVRNIFALSSFLESYQMQIQYAENGLDGINLLRANPIVDLILMDIMMPEMSGYETIQSIRQDLRFESIPIIALTAKAMKGDREKCLEAGASDYITKPVDLEQLLSLLRIWLYR